MSVKISKLTTENNPSASAIIPIVQDNETKQSRVGSILSILSPELVATIGYLDINNTPSSVNKKKKIIIEGVKESSEKVISLFIEITDLFESGYLPIDVKFLCYLNGNDVILIHDIDYSGNLTNGSIKIYLSKI